MKLANIIKLAVGGIMALSLIVIFLTSFSDVPMGSEGFIYRPYGNGIDTAQYYSEGTYFIAPWNTMVADVDLPTPIATEITNKETQKQKNLKSELMKIEVCKYCGKINYYH